MNVTWTGGAWFLTTSDGRQRILGNGVWLDAWLTDNRVTRADLNFGQSRALKERFINDFGRL